MRGAVSELLMRWTSVAVLLTMVLVGLAGCLDDSPAPETADAEVPEQYSPDDSPVTPDQMFDRYEERPAGVERVMRFVFGPYTIPPGQDNNRVTIDLPVRDGFMTAVSPNLYDVQTGDIPSNQHLHIHHAHWFRASDDPEDEYYTANLAWVFGTGEERTQGSLHDRAAVDPDGPSYGMFIEGLQPNVLIYMLHNKMNYEQNVYVALDVRFVYGTSEAIAAASDCPGLMGGEACYAGDDFHHLHGKLWGSTFDVPRQPILEGGDGTYIHPLDIPSDWSTRRSSDNLGRFFTASSDGTAIASAGHLHPNGLATIVANLGPAGSGCEADLDGDGLPGVTLFNSRKIEEVPGAFPFSEEYQMGATKPGWRAPIREGDRITQFSPYANDLYASYEAMSFAGLYVDREQVPAPRGAEGCTLENTAPVVLEGDPWGGDPLETVVNRNWDNDPTDHCGIPGWPVCEPVLPEFGAGIDTNVIHIANFLYLPGDQTLTGEVGQPIRVTAGDTVRVINEDAGAGIRHTVTSCKFPCNGKYVANYPHPDGDFDSGKLGNLDPIDGGIIDTNGNLADDTVPVWELDTTGLEPGYYTYYCRIHPWMRGTIEVV